jgi:hypothetical protein
MFFKDLRPGDFFKLLGLTGKPYEEIYLRMAEFGDYKPDRSGGGCAVNLTTASISGYFNSDDPVIKLEVTFKEP